jgi:hypothetical protein
MVWFDRAERGGCGSSQCFFWIPRASSLAYVTIVPGPSSMLLLGSGLLVVAMVVRRKLC